LLYALLPNKEKQTYKRFFEIVKSLVKINPTSITMDFERGALTAAKKVFRGVDIHGCFFHLCQTIMRRIQNVGLKRKYEEDSDFALSMQLLAALAFVPPADVESAFDKLVEEYLKGRIPDSSQGEDDRTDDEDQDEEAGMCMLPEQAQSVVDYFEDCWIRRPSRNTARQKASFDVNLWNCYEQTASGLPRTNNSVEAWHRGFETVVDGVHVNLFRMIDALQKENTFVNASWEQNVAREPPTKRRRYLDCAARLS